MRILIIGGGVIGGALTAAWRGLDGLQLLTLVDRHPARHTAHAKVVVKPELSAVANVAVHDVVVLAVRPKDVGAVCAALKPQLGAGQLVISVAAGLNLAWYETAFAGHDKGAAQPVMIAMPNLALQVGCSVTSLMAGRGASAAHKSLAHDLFSAAGSVVHLPADTLLPVATALASSGPAYVYALLQAMVQAAGEHEMPADIAAQLVRGMVQGAAELLAANPNKSLPDFISEIAVAGGTTEAGMKVLTNNNAALNLMRNVVDATAERSHDLMVQFAAQDSK